MVDSFDAAGPDLVDVVAGVLTEYGPLGEERLVAAVAARGVDLGDEPGGELYEALDRGDGLAALLADDRWAWLPALLMGRVFTHRVTASDLAHDVLAMNPDLEPLSVLVESEVYQRLVDGASILVVVPPFDADILGERGIPCEVLGEAGGLLLPAGYLIALGVGEGDVIGLRLTRGGLELAALEQLCVVAEDLARLGRRLGAVVARQSGGPVELDVAVWTACADEPGLFAQALPPLATALEVCGLVWGCGWLATSGFDFDRWRGEKRVQALARRHDLDDDEALAVAATVGLYDRVAEVHAAAQAALDTGGEAALSALATEFAQVPQPAGASGPTPPGGGRDGVEGAGMFATVRATMALLAEPAVAEAVLAETLGSGSESAAVLGLFAETCEPLAPRGARPALRWLRAKAYERLGEVTRAEDTYLQAESLDPGWPPTLVDLARYASDRGDAERGLALLRRAGAPVDDDLVGMLESFLPTPRPDLGRNQPCWCGSGRKYKACHLRREVSPLAERAGWLYQKAGMFLSEGPWWDAVGQVAAERARYADTPAAVREVVSEPLVADVVLFEGGAFAEFVATRGGLLPDDERLLAEQWLLIDRSVHEVEHVGRGQGITVRDVRTGDVHSVCERTASRQLVEGQLVCARVVPAGDTMQIFGGIEPVGLAQRDELIALLDTEPDPVDLVEFLTRRYAPPALCNTEGDPLVFCDATLRSGDPTVLTQALDDTYERTDDTGDTETVRWLEHVSTDGMQRIRATLDLERDQLRVHTNSEARMDRVLATLDALQPSIILVDQAREPARDAREMAQLAARSPAADSDGERALDLSDPDIAATLQQFTHDYERSWLDQPLPALAGHTPRQAAADPTRRDDLARLLNTFPTDPDNAVIMNPRRLRGALGLS